jgi:hypothetical protein
MAQFSKGWGSKIFTVRFGLGTFNNDPPSAPKLPDNHFGCYTLHQFNGQLGALSLAVIAFYWAFTSDIDDAGSGCVAGFSGCAVYLARSFRQNAM